MSRLEDGSRLSLQSQFRHLQNRHRHHRHHLLVVQDVGMEVLAFQAMGHQLAAEAAEVEEEAVAEAAATSLLEEVVAVEEAATSLLEAEEVEEVEVVEEVVVQQ